MSSLKKLSEGVAQCALRVGCDTRDRIGECQESETMEETSSMIFINWQASLNAARMSIRRTIHPFYESSEQSSRTKLKQRCSVSGAGLKAQPVKACQNSTLKLDPARLSPSHITTTQTSLRIPSDLKFLPATASKFNFTKLFHTTSQPHYKMDSFQQQQQQQPRGACYSCGSTAHQARDCPTKGPAKCYNCGGEGHMSRDCTEPMKDNKSCYKCGQPGHISRDCPMSGGSGQATECYKCGEIGHIARNCNKSSYGNNYGGGFQQQGGAGKTCYSCGGFGHMSRECVNGMKCYNCGESGHYSRDCPKESAGGEKICYKCQQPGHVQSQCPGN
ncbi:hypothetical protein SNK03_003665 [Fusarium graminearum]